MRFPIMLRRDHDAEVALLNETIRKRDVALSKMGHTVEVEKREHAKLLSDLRLVRVHIDYAVPSPSSDKIGFSFEMAGAVFDGFRRDVRFVDLLAYMVEGQMRMQPEGRSLLAGHFAP